MLTGPMQAHAGACRGEGLGGHAFELLCCSNVWIHRMMAVCRVQQQ